MDRLYLPRIEPVQDFLWPHLIAPGYLSQQEMFLRNWDSAHKTRTNNLKSPLLCFRRTCRQSAETCPRRRQALAHRRHSAICKLLNVTV
jgi:hypothetical protein